MRGLNVRLLVPVVLAATLAVAALLVWRSLHDRPAEVHLPLFVDVTAASGIAHVGMTHGAAWSDFDGDGWPDVYLTNHLTAPKLYRNLGTGRFEDVTDAWLPPLIRAVDKHGAAWGDVDNDGRPDLVQLAGAERGVGSEPKRLFMNRGNRLEDVGEAMGVANPLGRTRMPLWVDLDRDGRLDLFQGADVRFDGRTAPLVFMQRDGRFEASADVVAFASGTVPFCIVTHLTNSGTPDLACRVAAKGRTAQLFSTARLPLRELDPLPATAFEDIAAGDFDNDGAIDLFLARKYPAPNVSLVRASGNELLVDLVIDRGNVGSEVGFGFRTAGRTTFRVLAANPDYPLSASQIRLGAGEARPQGMEFTLTPGDEGAKGFPAYRPGAGDGLYVGFTPPDEWSVRLSASSESITGSKPKHQQVAIRIASTAEITELGAIGDPPASEQAPARLLMNRNGKWVEESDRRGVNARAVSAVNAVAGDFDNDMHLDLFVLASGEIGKQENLLLHNGGDGTFDVVAGAGGAAGALTGVGDSVTTADFDRDGCLDLLVASGGSMGRSLGLPSERGEYRLYRNVCSSANRWLAIDLEGAKSNRDGIGARVEVTAGGVRQVRVQDGGLHHRGQNHSRLHFGLGTNGRADTVTVRWPSGTVQQLTGVEANRIVRIHER